MDTSSNPSSHLFPQGLHHNQIQRVVSQGNANEMAYQNQYPGYDAYHRTDMAGVSQHDPRHTQQVLSYLYNNGLLMEGRPGLERPESSVYSHSRARTARDNLPVS
jgi:hypothetical protein